VTRGAKNVLGMTELLTPDHHEYEAARQVHNGLIDRRPALIARCHSTADVADAVRLARQRELEICVRGGGHNVAGRAVVDGALMIDLAPMKQVDVDPSARTVRAQPGLTWGEYNDAAAAYGLATTGGVVSTTGVAGLTLGGGFGWLQGAYGLAIDNLLGAEIVTADGETLSIDENTHPDLFWAVRGGGGNFGVVTSFTFAAHPVERVVGGAVAWPLEQGTATLRYYREVVHEAPDELTAQLGLLTGPDGETKVAGISMCHCGPPGQAAADTDPIRKREGSIVDSVDEIPYPARCSGSDAAFPKGALNYWKTGMLTDLHDDAIDALVEGFARRPSAMSFCVLEPVNGAVTRVAPTATAFPHRSPGFNLLLLGQWSDPSETSANIAWVRDTYESLRPHLTDSRYVNYLSGDDSTEVARSYGPNWDRLVSVKRRYDPANVFRHNQNIDPGA
jgi:FAD/FMN-containing dehydrogenase